jgi:hypothetical protein
MARYLRATNGDHSQALTLYSWNAYLSAALFELLHYSEVLLRNSMHFHLAQAARSGPMPVPWYDQPWLRQPEHKKIEEAKARVALAHEDVTEGRVVAELSFGFWCGLLSRNYDDPLWRIVLYRAFPFSDGRRVTVVHAVEHCRLLRNRIAHHEPVYDRDHADDQADALAIVGWISPQAQTWVSSRSHVPEALTARPVCPN